MNPTNENNDTVPEKPVKPVNPMIAIIDMVQEKYPSINEYLYSLEPAEPVMFKLIPSILFLRQKIGYPVYETDPFYSDIPNVKAEAYAPVTEEDLLTILKYVVHVTCCYIDDNAEFEQIYKQLVIDMIVSYCKP